MQQDPVKSGDFGGTTPALPPDTAEFAAVKNQRLCRFLWWGTSHHARRRQRISHRPNVEG
jgi:hypothetical protein